VPIETQWLFQRGIVGSPLNRPISELKDLVESTAITDHDSVLEQNERPGAENIQYQNPGRPTDAETDPPAPTALWSNLYFIMHRPSS